MPTEPEASAWVLPPADTAEKNGLVGVGADLEPGTLLSAYRAGIFPMPLSEIDAMGWWSPDPRGIIPLSGLQISRSLRRSQRRYNVTFDTAFDDVMANCASSSRDGGWITTNIQRAYRQLHDLGWAHSVETRDAKTNELVGGLYGIHINGLFAGESMFQTATDASKVALVALVQRLRAIGAILLDVQWQTPHLATLGAQPIPRREYLQLLRTALAVSVSPFTPVVSS